MKSPARISEVKALAILMTYETSLYYNDNWHLQKLKMQLNGTISYVTKLLLKAKHDEE
jgi:hypothetical protein